MIEQLREAVESKTGRSSVEIPRTDLRQLLAIAAERDALREALNAVIDEGVVNWHNASDDTRHVHEALGLTFKQYAAWVERDWPKFVKACPE